jgi:hypothetical protein
MTDTIQLQDIPDLSGIGTDFTGTSDPWVDGWYRGIVLEQRSFTDKNGNDRVFTSSDEPSARGDSRNIKLQVALKRSSDSRELNISYMLNYRPEDLTQEAVQAVIAETEKVKESGETRSNFRAFMTLQRLGKLQKIAGARAFQRNGNGGLNLSALYNKPGYFRVAPDDRNPQYKTISDVRADSPKQVL